MQNKDLLRALLDTLLPASAIRYKEKTFKKRYGLKCAEPLIRIRFLDSSLAFEIGWMDKVYKYSISSAVTILRLPP